MSFVEPNRTGAEGYLCGELFSLFRLSFVPLCPLWLGFRNAFQTQKIVAPISIALPRVR